MVLATFAPYVDSIDLKRISIKDFYKDNKSSWGKSSRCKRHFTKKDKDDDGDNAHLKFSKISESDFIGARKLLQKLGYDTSQNVSEQFNKKHKLN